jgi:hypothetical protein
MAAKVFISYRRDDSGDYAGRVHDRLEREFGSDLLFMDVDAIPLGANFTKVLREEVAKCDVLLALIGANWLDARNEDGKRRLDNPSDYLRIEIATALQRDIPVIPILLERATMPKAAQRVLQQFGELKPVLVGGSPLVKLAPSDASRAASSFGRAGVNGGSHFAPGRVGTWLTGT